MKLPKSLTTVTPFSKAIALFLFILLPFAGFYVGMKYQKATELTNWTIPTIIPTSQPVITPIQTNGWVTITFGDNNKTEYVHVGDNLLVDLGPNNVWNITTLDPNNILQNSRFMIAEKIGTKRFTIAKAGTAQILASGSAKCEKGQMCPLYLISFKTTVVTN